MADDIFFWIPFGVESETWSYYSFQSSCSITEDVAETVSEFPSLISPQLICPVSYFFDQGFWAGYLSFLAQRDPPVPASDSSTGGPISLIILIASVVASQTGFILSNQQLFNALRMSHLNGMIDSLMMAAKV